MSEPRRWHDYDGNSYDMGFEHAAVEIQRLIQDLIEQVRGHERLGNLSALLLEPDERALIEAHRKERLERIFRKTAERLEPEICGYLYDVGTLCKRKPGHEGAHSE